MFRRWLNDAPMVAWEKFPKIQIFKFVFYPRQPHMIEWNDSRRLFLNLRTKEMKEPRGNSMTKHDRGWSRIHLLACVWNGKDEGRKNLPVWNGGSRYSSIDPLFLNACVLLLCSSFHSASACFCFLCVWSFSPILLSIGSVVVRVRSIRSCCRFLNLLKRFFWVSVEGWFSYHEVRPL